MSGLERPSDDVLAALVANADDAIIVADAAGVVRFWNPAAEATFGHSKQEAIGASLDLIIPEKLRERHWEGVRRVIATGMTQYAGRTLAVPAVRADGTRILGRVHCHASARRRRQHPGHRRHPPRRHRPLGTAARPPAVTERAPARARSPPGLTPAMPTSRRARSAPYIGVVLIAA